MTDDTRHTYTLSNFSNDRVLDTLEFCDQETGARGNIGNISISFDHASEELTSATSSSLIFSGSSGYSGPPGYYGPSDSSIPWINLLSPTSITNLLSPTTISTTDANNQLSEITFSNPTTSINQEVSPKVIRRRRSSIRSFIEENETLDRIEEERDSEKQDLSIKFRDNLSINFPPKRQTYEYDALISPDSHVGEAYERKVR